MSLGTSSDDGTDSGESSGETTNYLARFVGHWRSLALAVLSVVMVWVTLTNTWQTPSGYVPVFAALAAVAVGYAGIDATSGRTRFV